MSKPRAILDSRLIFKHCLWNILIQIPAIRCIQGENYNNNLTHIWFSKKPLHWFLKNKIFVTTSLFFAEQVLKGDFNLKSQVLLLQKEKLTVCFKIIITCVSYQILKYRSANEKYFYCQIFLLRFSLKSLFSVNFPSSTLFTEETDTRIISMNLPKFRMGIKGIFQKNYLIKITIFHTSTMYCKKLFNFLWHKSLSRNKRNYPFNIKNKSAMG